MRAQEYESPWTYVNWLIEESGNRGTDGGSHRVDAPSQVARVESLISSCWICPRNGVDDRAIPRRPQNPLCQADLSSPRAGRVGGPNPVRVPAVPVVDASSGARYTAAVVDVLDSAEVSTAG